MTLKTRMKQLALAALSAGSSLVIAACYGAYYAISDQPMPSETVVQGVVVDQSERRLVGLSVCVQSASEPPRCTLTDALGEYELRIPVIPRAIPSDEALHLSVHDVDGAGNGAYGSEHVHLGTGEAWQNGTTFSRQLVLSSVDKDWGSSQN